MRVAKLNPETISVYCGKDELTDKVKEYPETLWEREPGRFDELVKLGFLVDVKKVKEKEEKK